jgi:hypothetical protein
VFTEMINRYHGRSHQYRCGYMLEVDGERGKTEEKGGKRMEMVLAILMALGIYVGIPVIIGLSVCGVYIMVGHRARREAKAEVVKEAEAIV